MFVDTHAHLFAEEFNEDRAEVVKRAADAGITHMLLPNIDGSTMGSMMDLASDFPGVCLPMIGLHPCSVGEDPEVEVGSVLGHYRDKVFCAVGETGLDYYWDKSLIAQQKKAFELHLEFAVEKDLPVVIHTRDSFQDAFEMVAEYRKNGLRGVFHCFTGGMKEAEMVMELGDFYMGIGGVITFKNSGLPEVVKEIPMEFLMLETDSPYLTPVPNRGKRNESVYLLQVAEKIADVKGISLEEVARITTDNAFNLFPLVR